MHGDSSYHIFGTENTGEGKRIADWWDFWGRIDVVQGPVEESGLMQGSGGQYWCVEEGEASLETNEMKACGKAVQLMYLYQWIVVDSQ